MTRSSRGWRRRCGRCSAWRWRSAAIGALAHTAGLEYSVVMKAVMDYADADKSDNFKKFAARASAECLLAFMKQHVPPRATRDDPILAPGTEDLPKRAGPAALLNARHQEVPFHGRKEVLDALRRWCEGEERVRARLIHAEGGMGKTRLAIELCKQMRAAGWRAGFLREDARLADVAGEPSAGARGARLCREPARPRRGARGRGGAAREEGAAPRIALRGTRTHGGRTCCARTRRSRTCSREEEPLALPSVDAGPGGNVPRSGEGVCRERI